MNDAEKDSELIRFRAQRAATSSSVMLSGPRREKELKFEYI